MNLRIRLLLGLLAGAVALAAFCLGTEQRSDGQQLSQFATLGSWPIVGASLALMGVAWCLIERMWRRQRLHAREAEREAMARELHDEFGQNLTVMVTAAGFLERHAATVSAPVVIDCACDMRTAATQMARQLRGHLQRLSPQEMQGASLIAALEALADGHWLRAAGVQVEVRWPPVLPALSPQAGLALYRTVQEALTNVVRHAGASRVVVVAQRADGGLRVRIEDDGRGGVQTAPGSRRSGLRGMQERAALAGGRLALRPSELGGLQVQLWLPLSETNDDQQGDKNHGECAAAG